MSEEERLIEEARRSTEETERLREQTFGERHEQRDDDVPESPLPEKHDSEPWAKTSSGDADSITDDNEKNG